MTFLARTVAHTLRVSSNVRSITTSRPVLKEELKRGPAMGTNRPDGSASSSAKTNADKGSSSPNTDSQSNASKEEHKSGDDHPAKQPDPQAYPTRSTGIGGVKEVEGGKGGRDEISEAGKKNLAGR